MPRFTGGYKKYRVWNMLSMLQRKSKGFDQSQQKRQMPRWLKKLYEQHFQNDAEEFFTFLELIKRIPKKTVKRLVRYHKAYDQKLTAYSAMKFISRC